MSSWHAQSQGAASSPLRKSVSLDPTPPPGQPSRHHSIPLTPEDDYNYHDTGPSISPTYPKQRLGYTSSVDRSDDPERLADELTILYEKSISGGRAKLPDGTSTTLNGTVAAPSGQPTPPATTNAPSRRQRRHHLVPTKSRSLPRSVEDTKLRKVELHWSREDEQGVKKVSLNACILRNDPSASLENSVLWQHSTFENIRLEELEALLASLQVYGLKESEIGLTERLINRVRLVLERSFVNGKFLTPTALRYDMLDDSKYNEDRCSIFLSFPYFAVKRPGERPSVFSKGAPEHPMRTLLQSRYRLNKTTNRDESQCITELSGDKVKSCIKATHQEIAHLTRKKVKELVYVPQLWSLIIGLDRIITAGPIGDNALHGSTLTLKDASASGAARKCSFVRISFMNRGVVESQIYPIGQCTSWFSLLNIHQQLRSVLKQGKEKALPKDFKLRIGPHTLTGDTWASVQRSTTAKVLNVWMDTPKLPIVSVQNADGNTIAEQQDAQTSDPESLHETTPAGTATSPVYEKLDPVDVIRPFLDWHVLDDFGNRDDSALSVKVNRFLSTIYNSLSASCAPQSTVFAPQTTQTPQSDRHSGANQPGQAIVASQTPQMGPALQGDSTVQSGQAASLGHTSQPGQTSLTSQTPQVGKPPQAAQMLPTQASGSGRPIIYVVGRTSKNVDDLTYHLHQKAGGKGTIVEQQLRKETVKLFNYYMPANHEETLAPVRLFWGLLYELIEHRHHLQIVYDIIQDINKWAKRLHLGVYYQGRIIDDAGAEQFESAISDRAILQATMIDALGAVFNMLVAAVRESRSGHSTNVTVEPWRRALRYGQEACGLLAKARDKLIAEATISASGEDLGPVITPEAIMIMLLERLAHGVYGSGTVNVINIFEECLEQLALDVEKRPSRRLLKRINAFQEEIDIVRSVLVQQCKVLEDFQTCLDPAEFKRPTTARKIRFMFEKSRIERVLIHINDQRRYCKELCDRAKVLEDQNVRLVETLADDNSRAIFIFTFITILFLPLSFVATFFGMNVVGINPTTSTTSHFWVVGAPLTGGIFVICMIFVFKGEDVWFFLTDLPANCVGFLGFRQREIT